MYRKTLEQRREALRGVPEQSGNSAPAPDGLTVLKETVARKAYEQAQKDVSGLDKQPGTEDNGKGNATDEAFDVFEQGDIITDGSHMEGGKLKPNVRYQTGEFAYIYETNTQGRICAWQADDLQLTERDYRLQYDANTPGKMQGDHAGHLAGDRFGGSSNVDNIVSQSAKVNLSAYKKIENQWAKAIKQGKKVTTYVSIQYEGNSARPKSFHISYTINGQKFIKTIKN